MIFNNQPSSRTFSLHSPDFEHGAPIPQQFTCDGENISPELTWTYQPIENASPAKRIESYVLIVDDPDAQKVVGKIFVHWIVLMPSHVAKLQKGISGQTRAPIYEWDGTIREIVNNSKQAAYYGPCPPVNTEPHTYHFTLFATNTLIQDMNTRFFDTPFTAEQFRATMTDSIVAETVLTGTYKR